MSEVIRVFVGCAANHEDAESMAVLEWSIRKHASQPVEIVWMQLSRDPESFWYSDGNEGWQTQLWATPFSAFRWAIPAYCGFEGRAIYCDSDVIFMSDIADLWGQDFSKMRSVKAKGKGSWRFCVSLWDCHDVRPHILLINELRSNPSSHKEMTRRFKGAQWVQPFEGNWNCLDGEDFKDIRDPRIDAIHYTVMSQQPHLKYAIPRLAAEGREHWFNGDVKEHWRPDLVELFDELLMEAERNGYPTERYCSTPLFGEYRKKDLSHYRGGARKS